MTDLIAPEHLHIATANAAELAAVIRNAGATFLGHYTPVALGDYVAGPSHVLPTGGTARWASGLSANDFLRAGSVIQYSRSRTARCSRGCAADGGTRGPDGPSSQRRHPAVIVGSRSCKNGKNRR